MSSLTILITQLSLVFDTGTLVLIWMVQLVVYPGFVHMDFLSLKNWHSRYTKRISLVVVPLMFGQLGISVYSVLIKTTMFSLVKLVLILVVWILTFSIFVPIHNALAKTKKEETQGLCIQLVQKNWSRTLLWTIIFFLGIVQSFTTGLS